jgi:hypothetical protein
MARIRTIKPSFWDDEKIGKLSPIARLLYIGTWTLADDEGILQWTPKYIKGHLFLYDDKITIRQVKLWMEEITYLKFIKVYTDVDGNLYGFIKHMHNHQKIDRPSPTAHPSILEAILKDNSTNPRRVVDEPSLLESNSKGKDSKGKDKSEVSDDSIKLSNLLKSFILKNNPKARVPEDLTKWSIEIDKMQRIDKRTFNEIEKVIIFCQNDPFWSANILSGNTLREKYDRLFLKMQNNGGNGNGINQGYIKQGVPGNRPAGAFDDI